jgi:hypothetical protein
MARKCLTYIDRGVRFQGPDCPGEQVFWVADSSAIMTLAHYYRGER